MRSSASQRRRVGARLGITPAQRSAAMIRIDHAGERGAVTIYQAQQAVLDTIAIPQQRATIRMLTAEMLAEEQRHLSLMEQLIVDYRVRPTLLDLFWAPAAYLLGVVTIHMGDEAALACTEAVETVISAHYREQAAVLAEFDAPLARQMDLLADEEEHHRDCAQEHGAAAAPAHDALVAVIAAGCHLAIRLSSDI